MYTNKMRFTGMSGIDTQSMVEQLMKAESMKLYKSQRNTQTIQWKQDAYRAQATTLQTFQKNFFDFTNTASMNMRSSNTFLNSSSSVKVDGKDSNSIIIKNSSGAKNSEFEIKIDQIAQKEVRQSGQFGGKIVSSEAIDVSSIKENDSISFDLDGDKRTIKFEAGDMARITLSGNDPTEVATILNEKLESLYGTQTIGGVTKNLVEVKNEGGKISFNPIIGHDFKITAGIRTVKEKGSNVFDPDGKEGKTFVFKVTSNDGPVDVTVDLSAIGAGDLTKEKYIAAINKGLSTAKVSGLSASTDSSGNITFTNTNGTKAYKIENTGSENFLGATGFTGTSIELNYTNVLNDLKITNSNISGIDPKTTLKELFNIGDAEELDFKINGVAIKGADGKFTGTSTIRELMDAVNKAQTGVKLSYNSINRTFTMESSKEGTRNKINIEGTHDNIFGFTTKSDAQDAVFEIDGVATSRPSNNFEINGVSVQINDAADNKVIKVKVTNDTTKTVENIKKFVEEYNKIIETINTTVKTPRQRTSSGIAYQPLIDDEKKAMSDSEVKLWEEKSKEGLLYNDSILRDTLSTLRNNIYQSLELSNGRKMSIHEIGITTSNNYTDGGKLVIDETKLTKALSENGDDVAEFFTKQSNYSATDKKNSASRLKTEGISERINDILTKISGNTGLISEQAGIKGTISESNSVLSKQLKFQQNSIKDMLKYLANKETSYYRTFSKMEAAMNQSNNQMSFLMSQMGGA